MADETEDTTADGRMAFDVAQDRKSVRMQIGVGEGKSVYLHIPTASLPAFQQNIGHFIESLRAAGILPPAQVERPGGLLRKWQVGRSDLKGTEKITVLHLNQGTAIEMLYYAADLDALQIADAIERTVFQGMPMHDQQQMIRDVEQRRGGKKIILPPGVKPN